MVGTNTRALWPALADALLMFPYTRDARLALLNLLCSQQVCCHQYHTYVPLSDACLLGSTEAQLANVLFCFPHHTAACCCCLVALVPQFDMSVP